MMAVDENESRRDSKSLLIAHPSDLFRSYLEHTAEGFFNSDEDEEHFYAGRMSMALEIITVIRTLEGVVGQSLLALNREEIISVLAVLLKENIDPEEAEMVYADVMAWRTPKFEAEALGASPDALASELASPEREAPPALDSPSSPAQLRMTRSSLSREESTSE